MWRRVVRWILINNSHQIICQEILLLERITVLFWVLQAWKGYESIEANMICKFWNLEQCLSKIATRQLLMGVEAGVPFENHCSTPSQLKLILKYLELETWRLELLKRKKQNWNIEIDFMVTLPLKPKHIICQDCNLIAKSFWCKSKCHCYAFQISLDAKLIGRFFHSDDICLLRFSSFFVCVFRDCPLGHLFSYSFGFFQVLLCSGSHLEPFLIFIERPSLGVCRTYLCGVVFFLVFDSGVCLYGWCLRD